MGEISQSVKIGRPRHWIRVDAIFDTGAEISFLRESLAKRINAPVYHKAKTVLADGSVVYGYFTQINMMIRNRIGLVDAIVIDRLDGDLLLGQDWLQKNDVIIDNRNERLSYGNGMPKLRKIYRLR